MSTETLLEPPIEEALDDYTKYRALCGLSVIAVLGGLLSLLAILDVWTLKLVPLATILIGWLALRKISQDPEEVSGRGWALFGISVALVGLIVGTSLAAYTYATEVREGFQRIHYSQLQPVEDDKGQPRLPQEVLDLDGKKVFIKGYAYQPAGGEVFHIKQFMLVRDKGDCCFGGNPKITDMILVTLKPPVELREWSTSVQRLSGTFRIQQGMAVDDLGGCIYHLDADYLD